MHLGRDLNKLKFRYDVIFWDKHGAVTIDFFIEEITANNLEWNLSVKYDIKLIKVNWLEKNNKGRN